MNTAARIIACSAALLTALPAYTAESYTIDPSHTWPVFEVNHLGFSTQRGRFNQTSGKITLDTLARKGSVNLTIATASLDMGMEKWDEHMKSVEFFNVTQHPTMRFTSDNLIFEGEQVVAAEGKLTLLGTTRPVTLTVSNFRCAPHPMTRRKTCGADIYTTIRRMQFGMAKFIPLISDEVKISSPVEATLD
ncbi:MAG TPA: YceI family protein [Gallionella sp.]